MAAAERITFADFRERFKTEEQRREYLFRQRLCLPSFDSSLSGVAGMEVFFRSIMAPASGGASCSPAHMVTTALFFRPSSVMS